MMTSSYKYIQKLIAALAKCHIMNMCFYKRYEFNIDQIIKIGFNRKYFSLNLCRTVFFTICRSFLF